MEIKTTILKLLIAVMQMAMFFGLVLFGPGYVAITTQREYLFIVLAFPAFIVYVNFLMRIGIEWPGWLARAAGHLE